MSLGKLVPRKHLLDLIQLSFLFKKCYYTIKAIFKTIESLENKKGKYCIIL